MSKTLKFFPFSSAFCTNSFRFHMCRVNVRDYSSWGSKFHKPTSEQKKSSKNVPTQIGSKTWTDRHFRDPYVKQRKLDSYRARSAYKLLEIDDRFSLLHPGMVLVELGAAPGSWTQVIVQRTVPSVKNGGKVIAVDLELIAPLDGATILENCDFMATETREKIMKICDGQLADGVLSDMAPNISGTHQVDHERIIHLAYGALAFAAKSLKDEERTFFLCKLFDGSERSKFFVDVKKFFRKVTTVKPDASRTDSSELYVLARHFKGVEKE